LEHALEILGFGDSHKDCQILQQNHGISTNCHHSLTRWNVCEENATETYTRKMGRWTGPEHKAYALQLMLNIANL